MSVPAEIHHDVKPTQPSVCASTVLKIMDISQLWMTNLIFLQRCPDSTQLTTSQVPMCFLWLRRGLLR